MVIEAVRLFLNTVVFAMPSAPTEDHDHKNDDMVNPTIFSNTEALIFGCDSLSRYKSFVGFYEPLDIYFVL